MTAASGAGGQPGRPVPTSTGGRAALWQPSAALNALKASIGVVVAWYICLAAGWPQPFMAPIAVLVLQTPYLGASLSKGLLRILGTLAGAMLVLGLLAWLLQDRWALISALSLVLGVAVWRMANSPYAYAWFMLAITVAVVAGQAAATPELAFQHAVYRTSEAIVGVLVLLGINAILWPQTGGRAYRQTFAAAADALAAYLRQVGAALAQPGAAALAPPPDTLRGAPVALREILAAAALDSEGFRRLRRTFDVQIQGLSAVIGSLMAFGDGMRLATAGERALLGAGERGLVRAALEDLAASVDALRDAAVERPQRTDERPPAERLAAARQARERLFAMPVERLAPGPAATALSGREAALRHAVAWQLGALIDEVEGLAASSRALAARRSLPRAALPPSPPAVGGDAFRGLPQALTAVLTFWLVTLVWIGTQWPPVGMLAVLMAVVVVGIETLVNQPIQQPGRRLALGMLIGILVTAPLYFLVLPRLDGAGALAAVLLPFFWLVLYLFHRAPQPRKTILRGLAIAAVILLQLTPQQQFDGVGWIGAALSMLTGFALGIGVLGIVLGTTPQAMLRRRLGQLLADMQRALTALADPRRPDFAVQVRAHDQAVRTRLSALAEVLPAAYTRAVPQNDAARIGQLFEAMETLAIRFRALQRARLGWRLQAAGGSDTAGTVPSLSAPGTRLGARWRGAFATTLAGLSRRIARPYAAVSPGALDALRDTLTQELDRLAAERKAADALDATAYLLAVQGHYVGVARALRQAAAAIDGIDWAAWHAARF
jgi:uncharacterized membrane protein YccC